MYLQQLESDSWRGEKLDKQKLDKMSGESIAVVIQPFIYGVC